MKTSFVPVYANLKDKNDTDSVNNAITANNRSLNDLGEVVRQNYQQALSNLTIGNRALISDSQKYIAESSVTKTQLEYLSAVTGYTGTANLVLSDSPTFTTEIDVTGFIYASGSVRVGSKVVIGTEIGRFTKLAASSLIRLDTYSTTVSHVSTIQLAKSSQNTEGRTATGDGDYLGGFEFYGVQSSGAAFGRGVTIYAIQNGAAGSTYIPADLVINNSSGSALGETARFTKNHSLLIGTTVNLNANSLFEIAKGGGSTTAVMSTYSTTAAHFPNLTLTKSHSNTVGTIAATGDGDILGNIEIYGVNSSGAFALGPVLRFTQVGAAGATYIGSKLEIYTGTSAGAAAVRHRIDPDGTHNILAADLKLDTAHSVYIGDQYLNGVTGTGIGINCTPTVAFEVSGDIKASSMVQATLGVPGTTITWIATDTQATVYTNLNTFFGTTTTTRAAGGAVAISGVAYPICALAWNSAGGNHFIIVYVTATGTTGLLYAYQSTVTTMGNAGNISKIG